MERQKQQQRERRVCWGNRIQSHVFVRRLTIVTHSSTTTTIGVITAISLTATRCLACHFTRSSNGVSIRATTATTASTFDTCAVGFAGEQAAATVTTTETDRITRAGCISRAGIRICIRIRIRIVHRHDSTATSGIAQTKTTAASTSSNTWYRALLDLLLHGNHIIIVVVVPVVVLIVVVIVVVEIVVAVGDSTSLDNINFLLWAAKNRPYPPPPPVPTASPLDTVTSAPLAAVALLPPAALPPPPPPALATPIELFAKLPPEA
jgi:hypothetical protein